MTRQSVATISQAKTQSTLPATPEAMTASKDIQDVERALKRAFDAHVDETNKMVKGMFNALHRCSVSDEAVPDVEVFLIEDVVPDSVSECDSSFTQTFAACFKEYKSNINECLKREYNATKSKMEHKAVRTGQMNNRADLDLLLSVGHLPLHSEWKKLAAAGETVSITQFLNDQLEGEQKDYIASIRNPFQTAMKQAKIKQLKENPLLPKPMLKEQNKYVGFVYVLKDIPLMKAVLEKLAPHLAHLIEKCKTRIHKATQLDTADASEKFKTRKRKATQLDTADA